MAIRVKNLNFFYGSSQTLFDINLEAEEGDTVVLLGPSGAGKSTLIRTLNLLEVPKSGELSIANNEFNLSNAMANPKAIRQLRQDVGMVFQQYHLWPHLTVIENLIEAPMKVRGVSENEAKTDAMELLTFTFRTTCRSLSIAFIRRSATTCCNSPRTNDEATSSII